jgi:hypothetical protein
MNGNTGWTTEAGGAISVEDCRAGKFKMLKDKPLKDRPSQTASSSAVVPDVVSDEEELPF